MTRQLFDIVPGLNFTIKDLSSVLILIIADHILSVSSYCSYKYD